MPTDEPEAESVLEEEATSHKKQPSVPAALGSICWLNMLHEDKDKDNKDMEQPEEGEKNKDSAPEKSPNKSGRLIQSPSATSSCWARGLYKAVSVVQWVFNDFSLRHLVWIKLIFLFQSASMTVLYPYLNLQMKSLGISVQETAAINAVIPILFIFTPPLAGFLADRLGNFRVLLSILTALGGLVSLLLLLIPSGRDVSPYPESLRWGVTCGEATNRARFQNMKLMGFQRDSCDVKAPGAFINVTFTPDTCGYLCPTRSKVPVQPRFLEYRVIWPNRGGGFGISEIVDIITLDSDEARTYHEPEVIDNNIFFPMNWTFHLSCDRIRPNDCIFNPIRRAPSRTQYHIQALSEKGDEAPGPLKGPHFDIESITPPETGSPVTVPVNCGSKELVAQVVSTVETRSIPQLRLTAAREDEETIDTRFSGCVLYCLVNVPRAQVCNNTEIGVTKDPSITFWSYLLVRVALGVLTAASLMMFEGAVMATIQELGGDYGIQRFVGNFGAIVFAPLGGYLIDAYSVDKERPDFSAAVFIYLGLKLTAALMILFIRLDFRPPGERILKNITEVVRNVEVVVFLVQMMFAGTFWGFIEGFLFWHLDDLGASKFMMGWTVAVGMITSLPFLIFSGPITDMVGHINVIVIGMIAYFARLIGYSYIENPLYVYPFEALEGFTMALMMTSAVTYVAKISSHSTIASVMGIMGALFFGVGKGAGSLFGGTIMSQWGARVAFRYFAGNALLCAFLYLIFQCAYVLPKNRALAADKHRKQLASGSDAGAGSGAEDAEAPVKPGNGVHNGAYIDETGAKQPANESNNKHNGTNTGPRSITGGTRV